MALVDLENPWAFGVVLTLTWIVVYTAIEVALFDGDVLRAAILGLIGGLAFSLITHYAGATEQ